MKLNFQRGWSLTELLICICIISLCTNMAIRAGHSSSTTMASSQIKSILSLAQSLASNQDSSIWISSNDWENIRIFNGDIGIEQKIHINGIIKYRGFLSNSLVKINSLGFTYNNGSFYLSPTQGIVSINKALRAK